MKLCLFFPGVNETVMCCLQWQWKTKPFLKSTARLDGMAVLDFEPRHQLASVYTLVDENARTCSTTVTEYVLPGTMNERTKHIV
jgi:hypothetical protein